MEISIKWNICRVCLQEEKKGDKEDDSGIDIHFVQLFNENKQLPLLIFELSGINMKPDDSLPDKICNKCLTAVNNAVQFRKTCQSSNSYLQTVLERTKSASNFFKPDISTSEVKSNYIDNGEVETQSSFADDNIDHQNENATLTDDTQTSNPLYDHLEADIEEELDDNISVEEIIEMSEDEMYKDILNSDQDHFSLKCNNIKQNIKDSSSFKKSETSQLQRFYMNTRFIKQKNPIDEQFNSNAIEKIFLEEGNLIADKNIKGVEDLVSEKEMNYFALDELEKTENEYEEPVASDLEEELNMCEDQTQAQVSSTVDTTEEFECYEDNSNISSDFDKQIITNETFNNRNISSTELTETTNNEPLLRNKRSKSPTVFLKPKMKRSCKSTAFEPVEVCVCEICGNRFTNQCHLKLHMKIHLQYKNYQCELCFKGFITSCNLQAHMRIHTGEKPFECQYCGRRFNDRSSHIRHERTHTNEKPFECFDCGKSFSLSTTLQNHMKVHSDERSYRCEPCGKSFKLPHHLKKHQSTTLHRSVLQIVDD